MIVEGKQVPPAAEAALENYMLRHHFTAGQAMRHAGDLLAEHGADPSLGHRMADRMIQSLRKAGKIGFKRVKGSGTVWSAAQ